jgi:hypothetical protein
MSAKHQVDDIRRAQRGKYSTRLSGHDMTCEGKVISRPNGGITGARIGSTFCSCGAKSPSLDSNSKRQAWHRQHKLDVLAARTAPTN